MEQQPNQYEQEIVAEANKQRRSSAFNMAQLDLWRLHLLWLDCNKGSQDGNLIMWKRSIDAVRREIYPLYRKDKPDKDGVTSENRVEAARSKATEIMKVHIRPKGKSFDERQNIDDSAYTYLENYEMELRIITIEKGISYPSKGAKSAFMGSGE